MHKTAATVTASYRILALAAFAALTGSVVSLATIAFVELVALLNEWLLISSRSRVMVSNTWLVPIATVCVPALGGLLVGSLWQFMPERRPLGVPDAIQSVQTLNGQLPFKSGLTTASASVISLGCGASVGQYGPLVHMGSTIGSGAGWLLRKCFHKLSEASFDALIMDRRSFGIVGIACGAAAAIATAFNAPIAGLVFSHEVILRHYSIRAFAPVTVAASIGYVNANYVFDQAPLFRINAVSLQHPGEYVAFVVIGIAGALLAIVFMRAVLKAAQISQGLRVSDPLKTMFAGLLVGVVALWQPEILGIGKEVLRFATIEGTFSASELVLLVVLKLILTAVCIGFGFAGGVFSPSLLIGILYGALAGICASIFFGGSISAISIYAICGMVAVTSPVIGAPLTTILIVFELTRNYDLALACMVSVVFANLVGYRFFGRSLFDVQLARRGVDLSRGREKAILENITLESHISTDYSSVLDQQTLAQTQKTLLQSGRTEAYVVDSDNAYCGTVTINQLLALADRFDLNEERAGKHAKRESLVFEKNTTVWQAMERLEDFVGESIPVVENTGSQHLVGVVFEATLVKAYVETTNAAREEEYASS